MQTKFKSRGKKAGAIAGWKLPKESGLASLVEFKAQRGTDKVILQLYMYMYACLERECVECNHVISKCIHAG